MTIHLPSNSLRFRNTDNIPFCYKIGPKPHLPSQIESLIHGGVARLKATFDKAGPCKVPVVAEFKFPVFEGDARPHADLTNVEVEVRKHEVDVLGLDENLITPTKLTAEMVAGLFHALDDHFETRPTDPLSTQAVVDAEELRDTLFAASIKASDIPRRAGNGAQLEIERNPVSVTPVEIKTPALVR